MPTKKIIKARSSHPYEKMTGQKLYKLEGALNCQIAPVTRTLFSASQHNVGVVAVSLYLDKPLQDIKKVIHTCGVKNCVLDSHLMYEDETGKLHRVSETLSATDVHKDTDVEPEINLDYEQYVINNSWDKTEDEIELLRAEVYKNGIPK